MLAEARRVEAEDADRVRSEDPVAYCAGTRAGLRSIAFPAHK
jgi:hypothetical protein